MSRAEKSAAEQSGHIQGGVRKAVGVVFMVFGTMCFASKSIFVKWAYEQGAQPEAVLLYRQLFAAPLFWLIFIVYRSKLPAKSEKAEIFKAYAAGLLCFFLSPLLDFIGLHDVSAIVERMIVMSYPMFVLIITAFVNKKMISGKTFAAIMLVNAGLFLAVGGWDVQAFEANLSGAFLILLSAVAYAVYLVVAGGLVRQIGGIRMNAYGMSAASLAMAGYALLRATGEQPGILLSYPPAMYGFFMIIAAVTTVIPFLCMLEGMKRIGAERGAVISMIGPVLTIFGGVLFLNERLTPVQWLGCFLVLLTISLLEYRK
ncbi:DMT family transporter [Bacillus haynesii]|uniref:DMT family transporter n=1 Tax=Bacillus haynesii TaxID=1925021 RepID=UPI0022809810|nr:DMT family transporter [Bacillus haynesii]MCY9217766.1 DMT family transporter [Bacillus haynesii]MCY9369778.1 DMT family transporter [Bacillus haynesii]MEC0719212.1 DMT family transporter [Bacillus haynesii]MEC0763089.1 DMT family transporter [Bacillus haynesii]